MPKAALPVTFAGFEKDAYAFWHELSVEMNKEWFTENKERYERQWVQPMTALLSDVSARLATTYKPLALAPPKVMRIYRDTRFAKDKAPYKTHIGAVVRIAGATEGSAVLYVHMGVEEEWVGCGSYMFMDTKLTTWRKLVAGGGKGKQGKQGKQGKKGKDDGAAIVRTVQKLRGAGYEVGGHDDLKRVPKPYDAEHPRAEFLKMKGLTAGFPEIPKGLIFKPGLVDWLVEHGRATAPLVSWLHNHVG